MRGFDFIAPSTLGEAIRLLDTDDAGVRAFAGGTALMQMMKSGLYAPRLLVGLGSVEAEHAAIAATPDGGLRLGALATLTAIEYAPTTISRAPVLSRVMKKLANPRVRNVARLGGTLAHADPHMDLPPALAALRGVAMTLGPAGESAIPVEEFYVGPFETVLKRGELVAAIVLPPDEGWRTVCHKVTTRTADDWPALGVAVSLAMLEGAIIDARVIVSAATEKLTRVAAAEAVLRGQAPSETLFDRAAEALAAGIETIGDARGSAAYKRELARVHLRRALREASLAGERT